MKHKLLSLSHCVYDVTVVVALESVSWSQRVKAPPPLSTTLNKVFKPRANCLIISLLAIPLRKTN